MALRAGMVFSQIAKVKPGNLTSPGSAVKFLFWDDLAPNTARLSETVDVDPVGLTDSLVTVTPYEHGNAVLVTIKIRKQSFSLGFDSEVADIVAYNMRDSIEVLAREALDASGTAVVAAGGTDTTTFDATDILTMNKVREQIAILRKNSVRPLSGEDFGVILHPDVAYDLMVSTTGGAWQDLKYTSAQELLKGEIGRFAGAVFLESPRAKLEADGGSSAVDAYSSYFLGQEALGEVETIAPHVVPGPITDTLMRFMPLGWYAFLGFGQLRAVASRRVISASSIGANS
jgi:N4-gp56 family major capsid protein